MLKVTKTTKLSKVRIAVLRRLDQKKVNALRTFGATSYYYPASRTRSKPSTQRAFRELTSNAKAGDDDEDEEEDGEEDGEKNDEGKGENESEDDGEDDDGKNASEKRSSIYINFKKSKAEVSKEVSKEDENVIIISNSEPVKKYKKQRILTSFIFDTNNDELMKNIIYLIKVTVKFSNFTVHKNLLIFIYKDINVLNCKNFDLNIILKNKRHIYHLKYIYYLIKIFAIII